MIAVFVGLVAMIQATYQSTPIVPGTFTINVIFKSTILELCPMVLALVLAGKLGASLAAKILTTAKDKLEAGELDGIIKKVSESLDSTVEAVNRMKGQIEQLDVAMYNRQILRLGEASDELRGFMADIKANPKKYVKFSIF